MKKHYLFLCIAIFLVSCDSDEKTIEFVTENVLRGAVLRTVAFNNAEFEVDNPQSIYSVVLEEQDLEDGGLLEDVDIFVSFIDNSPEDGIQDTPRILLDTLLPSDFANGVNNLPVTTLEYTFQELANAVGLEVSEINCKDQFRLDLDLNLSNNLTFNLDNAAGTIVNTTGFFKSPFTYLINVVAPISQDLYTGTYLYTSIEDGIFGPSFGPEGLVEVVNSHSPNFRQFQFGSGVSGVLIEFNVVCDAAVITRYQKLSFTCASQNLNSDFSDRVLLGPDEEPGILDINDDSVFELHFLEAFEGFDANCGFSSFPSKIRMSKQ